MAKAPQPSFEIPEQIREMAEQGVDQVRKAMDDFWSQASSAVDDFERRSEALREEGGALQRKAVTMAEENIKSSLDFAESLVKAKDPEEIMKLQQSYLDERMKALTNQMQELTEGATKMGADAAKTK